MSAPMEVRPILMEYSEAINELADALAHFQAAVPDIPRKSEVKYKGVSFKYADLPTILSKVREPLAKQGLSFVQGTESVAGRLYLTTMLMHKSGQWIRSRLCLAGQFGEMKGLGAAITYGRRYALSSLLGIASDDDIDDEPAIRREQDTKPRISHEQADWLVKELGQNRDLLNMILNNYQCKSISEIPASCWKEVSEYVVAQRGR